MSAADLRNLAKAYLAIKAKGAAVTFGRSVPGAFDATTGSAAPTVTTVATFALKDGSSLKTLGFKFGENLVKGGDIMATIPAKGLPFDPEPGDTLTFPEWPYLVVGARPVYSGALAVLWECVIRK